MSQSPTGLIHAKLLDGSGGARDLDWSEVGDWTPDAGALWLHFNEDGRARGRVGRVEVPHLALGRDRERQGVLRCPS